jgi:hypothetical protein
VFRNLFANSQECGTAFRRRLAIQFSKTERHPRVRDVLEPSLDRRGVAKTTVLRQGGGDLLPLPGIVNKVEEEPSSDPSTPETLFINPGPRLSSRGDSEASSFRLPSSGRCFYSHSPRPSSFVTRDLRLAWSASRSGAMLLPPPQRAVKRGARDEHPGARPGASPATRRLPDRRCPRPGHVRMPRSRPATPLRPRGRR